MEEIGQNSVSTMDPKLNMNLICYVLVTFQNTDLFVGQSHHSYQVDQRQ